MDSTMTNEIKLPDLPEWSKMDDLGRLVPSQVRQALVNYAREHEKNVRAALAGNAKPAGRTVGVAGTSYAAILNVALPVGTPLYTNPPIAQDRQSHDEGVREVISDLRGMVNIVRTHGEERRLLAACEKLEAAITPTNKPAGGVEFEQSGFAITDREGNFDWSTGQIFDSMESAQEHIADIARWDRSDSIRAVYFGPVIHPPSTNGAEHD